MIFVEVKGKDADDVNSVLLISIKIGMLKQAGVIVHSYNVIPVRYCVIDSQLIWYGDMNLLSNVKKDQVMLRYNDAHSASELLALSLF